SADGLAAARGRLLTRGLAAGPGAASGRIALNAGRAVAMAADGGGPVMLVRRETSPEDIAGMDAAAGILTARGGATSHAAVVARGMGKPCIVGCESISVDEEERVIRCADAVIPEGEAISIDGSTGEVYRGEISTHGSEIGRVLTGELGAGESVLYQRFEGFMAWADEHRSMKVRANADTPDEARLARSLGAEGIGLCRTEHMFFGPEAERILDFRKMILATDDGGRRGALDSLLSYQRQDFIGIFHAMNSLPVTIRLLDPPLHEFLPQSDEEIDRFAREAGLDRALVRARAEETRESNPMLGLRGCRLGITHPEIYEMQMRAIIEAALEARREGVQAVPEIMIPLTAIHTETDTLRDRLEAVAERVFEERGVAPTDLPYLFGTMIEIPRAALTADRIAETLDFFSFGTNDLTQMTFGLSRDDTAALLIDYVENGLLPRDPFSSLDVDGVGSLIDIAIDKGRRARPRLKIGICGEHGGDPDSVTFCARRGFDYVSCSPRRVPVARLAAAQAALEG
ncbi:MAG: putative PEP-binding protein, partial [Planctomycetota bacterium]